MGRFAGIDYGARRIGLAISDFGHRIASPAGSIKGSGSVLGDSANILHWVANNDITGIIVGLPINMDGSDSDQTRLTRRLVAALQEGTSLPIEPWDERLSSFQADEVLASAELSQAKRRRLRDSLAAQVILQSYLDAHREPPPTP